MKKLRRLGAALGAGLLVVTGVMLWQVVPSSVSAVEVSGPFVDTVTPRPIALNTWHDLAAGFTASESIWAEGASTVSIHNAAVNDRIVLRALIDGAPTYLGDYRMHRVNWTIGSAIRQYPLDSGQIIKMQVHVARDNGATTNVTLQQGQVWWTTIPRTVPTPTPTTPSPTPTTTPSPDPTTPAPPGAFPTPATTGVPSGVTLSNNNDCTLENGTYTAQRWTCDLQITGSDVNIINSEIHGSINSGPSTSGYSITDSTIGPPSGCDGNAAFGHWNITATRVEVRNFSDGARSEGPNILVQDSFFDLCAVPGGHGDAIQGCDNPPCGGLTEQTNVIFRHNTVDQPNGSEGIDGITANIFWSDGSSGGFRAENNLLIGGGFTIRVYHFGGDENVVTGNRIVNNSWRFNYSDSTCDTESNPALMHWVDNDVVTIDSGYNVTGTVTDNVPCI